MLAHDRGHLALYVYMRFPRRRLRHRHCHCPCRELARNAPPFASPRQLHVSDSIRAGFGVVLSQQIITLPNAAIFRIQFFGSLPPSTVYTQILHIELLQHHASHHGTLRRRQLAAANSGTGGVRGISGGGGDGRDKLFNATMHAL